VSTPAAAHGGHLHMSRVDPRRFAAGAVGAAGGARAPGDSREQSEGRPQAAMRLTPAERRQAKGRVIARASINPYIMMEPATSCYQVIARANSCKQVIALHSKTNPPIDPPDCYELQALHSKRHTRTGSQGGKRPKKGPRYSKIQARSKQDTGEKAIRIMNFPIYIYQDPIIYIYEVHTRDAFFFSLVAHLKVSLVSGATFKKTVSWDLALNPLIVKRISLTETPVSSGQDTV